MTAINSAEGVSDGALLEYAARVEYGSNHPVALSVREAYRRGRGESLERPRGGKL